MNKISIALGAIAILILSAMTLMVLPYFAVIRTLDKKLPDVEKDSRIESGRQEYVKNGCVYCHSQQPRNKEFGTDFDRGWGLQPEAADYHQDFPHQLGTMRTGPDLFNIGDRNPSTQWNLIHLYNPRLVVPWSTMPSFPFLFRKVESSRFIEPSEVLLELENIGVELPYKIAAKKEVIDLVEYLRSLKQRRK